MRIMKCPIRDDFEFKYSFIKGKVLRVEYKGKSDTFDFTALGEGDVITEIQTNLDINPIVGVEVKQGILHIKLLKSHGRDTTEDVHKKPEWEEWTEVGNGEDNN